LNGQTWEISSEYWQVPKGIFEGGSWLPGWPILAVLVGVLTVIGAVWIYTHRRRSEQLRGRFGKEYDRPFRRRRPWKAEQILKSASNVEMLHLRPLAAEDQNDF
jgi:hypothetical protein